MDVDLKEFRMFDIEKKEEITGVTTRMIAFGVATYKPGFGGPQTLFAHAGEGEEAEETYLVLKGKGIVYAGKEMKEIRMTPGMWIYIPANYHHGIKNDGDEDLVMLILLAPTPTRLLKKRESA
ncbi:MAG: cupin domain-containing protein [Candidatus Bathyarchaeia archaeon]